MDYTTLRVIWWLLLGILLAGFAVLDGFDMGASMWLPLLGKTDQEKRFVLNTFGPVWESNQVWFILGGGAIFAAWPYVYAAAFSGLYLAMLLVLVGFILRPVAIKYRSKVPTPVWRKSWDGLLALSGFLPSLLFGVAAGNVFLGLPFHYDPQLVFHYEGHFYQLLRPFPLYCGLVSLSLFLLQGATFLGLKTIEPISSRAHRAAEWMSWVLLLLWCVGFVWSSNLLGYRLGEVDTAGPSTPFLQEVSAGVKGAWLSNYHAHPVLWAFPLLVLVALSFVILTARRQWSMSAFLASSVATIGVVGTWGVSLFPMLLPSSSHPSQSLTVWNASSSQKTLYIMLWATIIFLPIILSYVSWVYRVMRGRVGESALDEDSAY